MSERDSLLSRGDLRKFKRDFILFFAACQFAQAVIIILAVKWPYL